LAYLVNNYTRFWGFAKGSPDFYFSKWESFGDRHNNGYQRCIDACDSINCFIDIGAHIGLYTLPISKKLSSYGKVYAFEPSISNFRYLLHNVRYNNLHNVTCVNKLVGQKNIDHVKFYDSVESVSALNSVANVQKPDANFDIVSVPQITLDTFCNTNAVYPDVLKIDVEGAELNVLLGAKNIIKHSQPIIFLSVHPEHLFKLGSSVDELVLEINNQNYSIYNIDGTCADVLDFGEYILLYNGLKFDAVFNGS